MAVGDLNRDGKLDLITASARDNVVSVLLGNGDGTFAPRITTDLGWGRVEPLAPVIKSLAFGDLNADGKLDMVFADGSYSHSVLLGNGDGTFGAPRRYVSDYSASPAIGDFNRDRKPDLAIAGPGVEVRLGNGDGTFGSATLFGPYEDTPSVAIGDMNGDGDPDLVAVTVRFNEPSWVSVLLGNGDGTFVTNAGYGLEPGGLASVAVGDLNGDGKADVVEAHPSRTNSVGVLLGNGDGTLGPVSYYGAGRPWSVAIGDFNRDGKPDLAVVNIAGNEVPVGFAPRSSILPDVAYFAWRTMRCSHPGLIRSPGMGAKTSVLACGKESVRITRLYMAVYTRSAAARRTRSRAR